MHSNFLTFRSSATPRESPSPHGYFYQIKCVVCGQKQFNGVKEKSRICESNRAQQFREAAFFLLDDVYTQVCDLKSNSSIFGADLYYHQPCLAAYIQKCKRATNTLNKFNTSTKVTKRNIFDLHLNFVKEVIGGGSGISLSEIRDMINDKENININNSEVKSFLVDSMGDRIQFSPSARSNESLFVFSSKVSVHDVVKYCVHSMLLD